MNKKVIIEEILEIGLKNSQEKKDMFSKDDFHKLKNQIYSKYKLEKPIANIELIDEYNKSVESKKLEDNIFFRKILRKRWVRSQSWVTVISLLTQAFPCPWKCIYCPSFSKLPKSYIPNEPAVMRAELNNFDPIAQIHNRLRALEITGHKIEKNDVRIIWGTWSTYPLKYQEEFIKWIYDAFNTYDDMKEYIIETDLWSKSFASFSVNKNYKPDLSKDLEEAKKLNETSRLRVIWIAIETRPDFINPWEIKKLRRYWITRVEIWYQTTFDEINKLNKRWHWNKESIYATKLLKDAWFKTVAHMMPNLLGSTPKKDIEALEKVFDDSNFRPDELKIYPMVVTKNSELTKIWEEWNFKAYDDKTLIDLTCKLQAIIPEYIRLNRTYRDIPSSEILEWSHLANLRQIVEEKLKKDNIKLVDIRHREIKFWKNDPSKAILNDYKYEASDWIEHFLTFEDPIDRTIFSLLRLRLPPINNEIINVLPELKDCALIREVHTFWDQLSIWEKWKNEWQHLGFGKRLLEEAEKIAKEKKYIKMAVIAWVWVRQYYEKRWYKLEWEYMIKTL